MAENQLNLFKGDKRSRARSILVLIAVCSILFFNAILLYRNMSTLRTHERWVTHTHEVLSLLEQTLSHLKDTNSSQRGFVITGDKDFLERYQTSRFAVEQALIQLKSLVSDNPLQSSRIKFLASETEQFIGVMDVNFSILPQTWQNREDWSQRVVKSKEGLNNIRSQIGLIEAEESRLLKLRVEIAQSASDSVDRLFLLTNLISFSLAIAAFLFVQREFRMQANMSLTQERVNWIKTGLTEVATAVSGDQSLPSLGDRLLAYLAKFLDLPLASVFSVDNGSLHFVSGYAIQGDQEFMRPLRIGEGLLGEAVRQNRVLHITEVPDRYNKVSSSLGEANIRELMIVPIRFENQVIGVLELGNLQSFNELQQEFLDKITETVGVGFNAVQTRTKLQSLLEETQSQSEELQAQQEELRVGNEELGEKTNALQALSDRLLSQQRELIGKNEEMQRQALVLEEQQKMLSSRNTELIFANEAISEKANELELANQYKSEFLANMSHELRTPLNSLLILATLLYENKTGNLNEQQINFAKTIHRSGEDLLNLINDILDLAKVEAGRLGINKETVELREVFDDFENMFRPMVEQKGLQLKVEMDQSLPTSFLSDRQRLEQILKNFMSNACKFTSQGSVTLKVCRPDSTVPAAGKSLMFQVIDTGIGIAHEKQKIIFEAFQQADSSTSRKYGGTGLGLTISRELARLLGGEIKLQSEYGKGSVFSLIVPEDFIPEEKEPPILEKMSKMEPVAIPIEWTGVSNPAEVVPLPEAFQKLMKGAGTDRTVMIIEDDKTFGDTLQLVARDSGFQVMRASDGGSALNQLANLLPHGIILDIKLPDMSGLSILSSIKENPTTSHIPVHVISGFDYIQSALNLGAVGYLLKPVNTEMLRSAFDRIEATLSKQLKQVLVVEDNEGLRDSLSRLIQNQDIHVNAVGLAETALLALQERDYDCIILDLTLPQISGFEFLENLSQNSSRKIPPVIVYTGKELSEVEMDRLHKYSDNIILKGLHSPERLLDEVSLFLHRVELDLPSKGTPYDQTLKTSEEIFKNKKVLLVDDDMRNVFALSHALEARSMQVIIGKNGQEAMDLLEKEDGIDLVLMDIMMPIMDGYRAIELIRQSDRYRKLPIIALTAKAMKGDQEKCLAVGASDYLPKPIHLDRLFALLKVWLTLSEKVT